jgi:2,4-dienoyl-CoA reductase-like NADH-dependent reductase (Old Yellow Enzyme family)
MPRLDEDITLPNGAVMKNRFMLAPMTNKQSHEDGTLSDDELHWLVKRAQGGFAAVMTCAANVQKNGKTWTGELGIYSDEHIDGLKDLTEAIHGEDSLALMQIFHGGLRASREINGGLQPVAPSDDESEDARGLSTDEVRQLVKDFISAAVRSKKAGFDGIEVHGAHGYIITQFLSTEFNRRDDEYGGSFENRSRLLMEIIAGIRRACGDDFILGLRLSPEGNGLDFGEMHSLAAELLRSESVDFLDMSLWDCFKYPDDPAYGEKPLLEWYTGLSRGRVPLGVAGKLRSAEDVQRVIDRGADFALIGRGAILHHDFPRLAIGDAGFSSRELPVSADTLRDEGLSKTFIDYMSRWEGFVKHD